MDKVTEQTIVDAFDLDQHYGPREIASLFAACARLATPAPDSEKLREAYLVWSNEHQAWWGKNRCGYTRFIDRAGRYDRSEALSIAGTRDGGWHVRKGNPDEIAIPERDAIDQYASITQSQRDDAALALGASS